MNVHYYFDKISKISNWILIVAGIFLLVFQLNGFFTDHDHHDDYDGTIEHKHSHSH